MTVTELPRLATVDDLSVVVAVEQAGFPPADQWSPDAWRAELTGDRIVLLAGHDGVSTWQVVHDVADLLRVVVRPIARQRGVARQLLQAGLAAVAHRGAHRALLEVDTDNLPAIRLYTSLGFVEIARRSGYYGVGRDASIMELVLGEEPR